MTSTEGTIQLVFSSRYAPGISHLLFSDDTMLFFKDSKVQAEIVKECLNGFSAATGQSLNYNKCSILFSDVCPPETQDEVREALSISIVGFEDKYLGLPTPDGRMSNRRFHNLQAQLIKHLMQWGDGFLAHPGWEVSIKSVAQALPTYLMGIFKLPYSVCDDLTYLIRSFYWGASEGKRKVHWKAWPKIQQAKSKGGAGFKDLWIFNQALLARQAWRLLIRPESRCARLLKAKYYPNGRFEDMVFSGNTSSTWTTISHGLDLLKKGLIGRVGDGTKIRAFRDSWIPIPYSFTPISPQGRCRVRFVSGFLNNDSTWNHDLLQDHCNTHTVSVQ